MAARREISPLQLLSLVGMLAMVQAQLSPPPPSAAVAPDVLPGCPSYCGGIHIPYPFGIGRNCSHPDFEIECSNGTPYLFYSDTPYLHVIDYPAEYRYEVREISVANGTMRIAASFSPTCKSSYRYWTLWTPWIFRPSPSGNVFTVIGCNILGLFNGYTYINRTVGCISTCPPPDRMQSTTLVETGACGGIGCCEISIGIGALDFQTAVRKIDSAEIRNISDINECYRTFLVEKGMYNFTGIEENIQANNNVTRPLLLEWSIQNATCEVAETNRTGYACKSQNSNCTYVDGFGYRCICSRGYEGNPYLEGGCIDIDECKLNAPVCGGNRLICINTPGSYKCSIPVSETKSNSGFAIALAVSVGFCVLNGLLVLSYLRWKRIIRRRERKRRFRCNHELLQKQLLLFSSACRNVTDKIKFFSLKELRKATNSFDDSYVVGKGGHGVVYKGLIDLQVVAIKKSKVNTQEEIQDFINEIILLSQISHRNIVRLVGCCFESEVPLLVYEFISNGTLSEQLHSLGSTDCPLPWEDRLRMAVEISSGLTYLHSAANISIFHRDIKSANVLLDDKLTAKISDFGASKFIDVDHTHVSTIVQGTMGYMDPEYWQTGRLTEKSDVYSMGVILVELVTGKKPTSRVLGNEENNVISHFISMAKENRLLEVVEDSMVDDENSEEIATVARLAAECLRITGAERPTMKDVEVALGGIRKAKNGKKTSVGCTARELQQGKDFACFPSFLEVEADDSKMLTLPLSAFSCSTPYVQ